jgi:hypothetical protein
VYLRSGGALAVHRLNTALPTAPSDLALEPLSRPLWMTCSFGVVHYTNGSSQLHCRCFSCTWRIRRDSTQFTLGNLLIVTLPCSFGAFLAVYHAGIGWIYLHEHKPYTASEFNARASL